MSQPKLSGDNVRAYLRDIGRIPLLEHDEEIILGRRVQRLMELQSMKTELERHQGQPQWMCPSAQQKSFVMAKKQRTRWLRRTSPRCIGR